LPQYNNPNWNAAPVDQTKFNVLLFVVPAMFDLGRYGLMFIAVKLTYNSLFMFIRGKQIIKVQSKSIMYELSLNFYILACTS
jgi:hypothetical protein